MPIPRYDPPHLDDKAQFFGLLSDRTRLRVLLHLPTLSGPASAC